MSELQVATEDNKHLRTLDLDKIHRVITWAAEGLSNVAISDVNIASYSFELYRGLRKQHKYLKNKCAVYQPSLINEINSLLFDELSIPDKKRRLLLYVLLPQIFSGYPIICVLPCNRERLHLHSIDIRELLRVTIKYSRAPPPKLEYDFIRSISVFRPL